MEEKNYDCFVCTNKDVTMHVPTEIMYRAFMFQGIEEDFGIRSVRFVRLEEGAKLFGVSAGTFAKLIVDADARVKWRGIIFADVDRICKFLETCIE